MGSIITTDNLYQYISNYNASKSITSIGSIVDGMPAKLIGVVVDVEDSMKQCRIKAHIDGITRTESASIETNDLPWFYASPAMLNMYDVPAIDDWVEIDISSGIYQATWHHIDARSNLLLSTIGDDISTSKVIFLEDAARFGSEGTIGIWWTPTDGWMWQFNKQVINMRADGTISIADGNKMIHMTADDKISIGTETQSKEPATLGETNKLSHENTLQYIADVVANIETVMKQLSQLAKANPYTASLVPGFESYAATVSTPSNSTNADCKAQLPDALSTVVSID